MFQHFSRGLNVPGRQAEFSEDRKYRYSLEIRWGRGKPINFIMLNPSTADEVQNDPTVERCERRAKMWGYGAVTITNIFALRSTDPEALYAAEDPEGAINDAVLMTHAIRAEGIICAWGQHGKFRDRGNKVMKELRDACGFTLHYLRMGSNGQPCHPLYLPYDLTPEIWA